MGNYDKTAIALIYLNFPEWHGFRNVVASRIGGLGRSRVRPNGDYARWKMRS
jgi:hypothetical protein